MNYFGMIFCFMVPGMIVGGMAVSLYGQYRRKRVIAALKERKADAARWYERRVG